MASLVTTGLTVPIVIAGSQKTAATTVNTRSDQGIPSRSNA